MNPALGPFAIASVLLVVAGALKAVRPHDTAHALRAMGLPGSEIGVRAGGTVELALGLTALAIADAVIVAVLVALSYAVFCAFVMLALVRRLPISSCGCFGKVDTPPSVLHVGVAVGACIAALGMAFDASDAPLDVIGWPLFESAAFVVLVAAGASLSFVLLTMLPRTSLSPSAGT